MTTLAQWIGEVRDYLDADTSNEGNQLAQAYYAGSGSITLTNALGNIGTGAWLAIGTNTLLVTAVNQLTKTASVVGGQRGSVDANADAGSLVLVNPRFTDYQIYRAINRHLPSLSSPTNGLYQVATINIADSGSVEGYDLTGVTGLVRVLEVRRETWGPSAAWPTVDTTSWDVLRSAPSDFASGISLRVRGIDAGLTVQVVYAKTFTALPATLTADVSASGVTTEMEDIPPLGAAIRLMSGREVSRNRLGPEGDVRMLSQVPQGAVMRSYQDLVMLWQQRVKEESTRLRAMYPVAK